jgi:hypothetical protein
MMILVPGLPYRFAGIFFASAGKYFFKEVKAENPPGKAPGANLCEQSQST